MARPRNEETPVSRDTTHFGFKTVLTSEKARKVADVFHSVAGRYDVMNDVMSLGTHRIMKRIAVEMTGARAGDTILDLAGGTGDLTKLIAPVVGEEGTVVLADINDSMLSEGRDRLLDAGFNAGIEYTLADAEALPFPDGSFNAVIIGFGLRNVTHKERAIEEMHRVLAERGKLIVLEFSHPENPALDRAYKGFNKLWPTIGEKVTGDRDSYQYLVESIEMHPKQQELADMITDAGFRRVRFHNLLGGIVAIHEARR